MRKILIIGCLFMITLSCKAQIVPVEQMENFTNVNNGIPDGTYFKDINHLFDKYAGTWKGIYNNREYTFYITKHTDIDTYFKFTQDEILVRYLITNPDGSIVEDTRSTADDGDFIITGDMFSKNADYYYMVYAGREADCGQSGTVVLRPKSATQLKISLQQANLFEDISQKCPAGRAVQLIPLGGMTLTKQ